jgi:hypothetical protein
MGGTINLEYLGRKQATAAKRIGEKSKASIPSNK